MNRRTTKMASKEKRKRISRFSTKTSGLLNFADLKKPQFRLLYWSMFLILFIISLVCLLPTLWVGVSGFKEVSEMYAVPPTILPKTWDIGKVGTVWQKVNVIKYFTNSVMLIIGCWACDIVINGLAGYVLSRLKPVGSRVIETLVFWSMLLPGISMVPLYMTFVDVPGIHANLIGSYVPIWIMSGANAFNILLFRNFFNSIPMSYLEAARIDGCSDMGIFGRIILPLSKPIIMVVTIFSITGTWGNFMWPYLILGNTQKEPVAVMLYRLSSGSSGLMDNEYMLLMMISIIPMIIMYAIFSKHIMGGLNMSGLKG